VAAIKAAQLGLRVRHWAIFSLSYSEADFRNVDRLCGKAWCSRRNVSERRMYTLESYVEQLTPIPPSTTRL
jgi:hypothetical protein